LSSVSVSTATCCAKYNIVKKYSSPSVGGGSCGNMDGLHSIVLVGLLLDARMSW